MSAHDPIPPVPFWRLFLKQGGWIVLIVGAVLLVLTLVGHFILVTAQRFEAEGREAVATVTEKYTTESVDSDGDRSISYWLTLDYQTRAGEEITTSRIVRRSEYRRAEVGGELALLYLESAPERTELTRGSHARGARVLQIVALAVGVLWLAALWVIGRWSVEAVRARRYGAREEAKVTEVHRTAIRVNKRPRYRLMWKDGQGRPGKSLLRRRGELEHFRPGNRIVIYQGLKRAWWAGDVGDRDGE